MNTQHGNLDNDKISRTAPKLDNNTGMTARQTKLTTILGTVGSWRKPYNIKRLTISTKQYMFKINIRQYYC